MPRKAASSDFSVANTFQPFSRNQGNQTPGGVFEFADKPGALRLHAVEQQDRAFFGQQPDDFFFHPAFQFTFPQRFQFQFQQAFKKPVRKVAHQRIWLNDAEDGRFPEFDLVPEHPLVRVIQQVFQAGKILFVPPLQPVCGGNFEKRLELPSRRKRAACRWGNSNKLANGLPLKASVSKTSASNLPNVASMSPSSGCAISACPSLDSGMASTSWRCASKKGRCRCQTVSRFSSCGVSKRICWVAK